MSAKFIHPKGKFANEFAFAMSRANGRCQAIPDTVNRCPHNAVEVIEEKGQMVALCAACRRAGAGLSPPEKREATRRWRARQLSLVGTS